MRSGRRWLAGAAIVPVLLGAAACGGTSAPSSYTIHGTVSIVGEMPTDCQLGAIMDGYWADLHGGAKVVVKDLGGKVLATTALSAPKASVAQCQWMFEARVPAAKFYSMKVPHVDEVIVPFSTLQKNNWKVQVTAK